MRPATPGSVEAKAWSILSTRLTILLRDGPLDALGPLLVHSRAQLHADVRRPVDHRDPRPLNAIDLLDHLLRVLLLGSPVPFFVDRIPAQLNQAGPFLPSRLPRARHRRHGGDQRQCAGGEDPKPPATHPGTSSRGSHAR